MEIVGLNPTGVTDQVVHDGNASIQEVMNHNRRDLIFAWRCGEAAAHSLFIMGSSSVGTRHRYEKA
jgi:hypothetical protein